MIAAGFKSRFGRKASTPDAAATATAAPGAAALPEAEAAKPAPEEAKTETKPTAEAKPQAGIVEAAKPDQKAPAKGHAKAEPVSSDAATPPVARMVEGASRQMKRLPDLDTLKGGLGRAATAAKPGALPMAAAAALILALGIGYGVGSAGRGTDLGSDQLRASLLQTGQDVSRLGAELKTLKTSFDGLKQERDKGRGELQAKQGQLADKIERVSSENVTRTSRLADQIEKGHRALTERMEKLERLVSGGAAQSGTPVAAAPTPPVKPVAAAPAPPDVERTGSVTEKKAEADPRKTKIEGIYVRDIDDGFALIEMKNGGYMDVAVGYTVPGVGRVEAIERRGRQWVVVTPKGYIGER